MPFGKLTLLGIGTELADHVPELSVVPLLGLEVLPGFAQGVGQLGVLSAECVLITAHGFDRPLGATVRGRGGDLGRAGAIAVGLVAGAEPGDGALLTGELAISLCQLREVDHGLRRVLLGLVMGTSPSSPVPTALVAEALVGPGIGDESRAG
ncbi:hypothetical protein [Kocuria palustris]|uniref:hypothetical protein n=1 Tax=Kocuria palustris TaxID=71999 RepID=UPI001959A1FC|nr:hypothetical protein [Kocuria palustris]MBM7824155.1 hypothetical protein [Kocuria palustris]MDH5152705.1 hypothetical protein [Kocuria palustris]